MTPSDPAVVRDAYSVGYRRRRAEIPAAELGVQIDALFSAGYRTTLVAAHDDGDLLRVVYLFTARDPDRRVELQLRLDPVDATVPSQYRRSVAISRFEREMQDLFGITPAGHPSPGRLVAHGHWPRDWHPMRPGGRRPVMSGDREPFPFLRVEGEGVYQIPVGPVHAGLIEPGHFRFSVLGETIIDLKPRLWYVHKGIEKLFQGKTPRDAVALAERISGDSAVAHSLAFCLALEDAMGLEVSTQDLRERAILLEMERLYNHVADIGALCNDVGFGFAHTHAMRIRESLLRLNETVTGHRLLRGAISPGATDVRKLPKGESLRAILADVEDVVALALANTTVRDRFSGTAVLARDVALDRGVLGPVARASGIDADARRDHPFLDLGGALSVVVQGAGDVMARFLVRVDESRASVALIEALLDGAGSPPSANDFARGPAGGTGVGIVEGWRGATVHRVELNAGVLRRVKVADPSFFNWPALPAALKDTIVPDFPLVNKSFNLSYAGNDL